jgi:hypothetical protein
MVEHGGGASGVMQWHGGWRRPSSHRRSLRGGEGGGRWAVGCRLGHRRPEPEEAGDCGRIADGVINDKKCCSSAGDGLGAGVGSILGARLRAGIAHG